MLFLGSTFEKMPILSLRTSTCVGHVIGHLINPHKLKVDALWCAMKGEKEPHLILLSDIREITTQGVIVDDHQVAVTPDETVRLQPIIDLAFELIDKKVVSGHITIGRVDDYAVDKESLVIQKIYARPSVWNMLKSSRLTYDRSQVVEVSHKYVRVADSRVKSSAPVRKKKIQSPSLVPSASASTIEE